MVAINHGVDDGGHVLHRKSGPQDGRRFIDLAENLCLSSTKGTMVRIETARDLYR